MCLNSQSVHPMNICWVQSNYFEPKFNIGIFKRDFLKMREASYRTVCDTTDENIDLSLK